jgi:hypothetical protein
MVSSWARNSARRAELGPFPPDPSSLIFKAAYESITASFFVGEDNFILDGGQLFFGIGEITFKLVLVWFLNSHEFFFFALGVDSGLFVCRWGRHGCCRGFGCHWQRQKGERDGDLFLWWGIGGEESAGGRERDVGDEGDLRAWKSDERCRKFQGRKRRSGSKCCRSRPSGHHIVAIASRNFILAQTTAENETCVISLAN